MSGLCTDLYELRMAASYLRRNMVGPATFSLFVRRLPSQRGFLVAAGLADALTFLERFEFDDEEIDYLRDVVDLDATSLASLRATSTAAGSPPTPSAREASTATRSASRRRARVTWASTASPRPTRSACCGR